MFRDILVHLDGRENGRRCARLASELCERMGAQLTGLHVTPPADVPTVYKPSQVEAAVERAVTRQDHLADTAEGIFNDETSLALRKHWLTVKDGIARGISQKARLADIVIMGQDEQQEPIQAHPLPVAHAVIVSCGRPVLIVPEEGPTAVESKVVVAWDGSREAARALHDAFPLLRLAQGVDIIAIRGDEPGDDLDLDRLVAHLEHHEISAAAKVVHSDAPERGDALLASVRDQDYSLIVMGGYSHPRWKQFMFGGTTLSMLLNSNIPLLVSH